MMHTIVLKFGGSSLADNIKLKTVANKIIELYNQDNKIVVVVSAQGKTTDKLIKQAKELANTPDEREMDVLLSTGEQISISKLSILLNNMGYPAVSLTGWQAGIFTDNKCQSAKIEYIDTSRIMEELAKNKVVIVAGFQGINSKGDISTLGRGGSDTTAVAIAAAIKADHCYIFSDVDGIYTADPNKFFNTKKLESISYEEMLDLSNEGAKVLHNRCVEIAKKYNINIEARSTFNNNIGTIISDKMEENSVKSIVENNDLILVLLQLDPIDGNAMEKLYIQFWEKGITLNYLTNNSEKSNFIFIVKESELDKVKNILKSNFETSCFNFKNISKISFIGYGIADNEEIIKSILEIINSNNIEILNIQIDECKISIITNERLKDEFLNQFHNKLIK